MPEIELFPPCFEYDLHTAMQEYLGGFQRFTYVGPNGRRRDPNIEEIRAEICYNLHLLESSRSNVKECVIRQFFKKSITDLEFRDEFEKIILWVIKMRRSVGGSKVFLTYKEVVLDAVRVSKILVNRPRMRENEQLKKDIEDMELDILKFEELYRLYHQYDEHVASASTAPTSFPRPWIGAYWYSNDMHVKQGVFLVSIEELVCISASW